MKALVLFLSVSITSVAFASGEALFEAVRCQGPGIEGTISIYARISDMEKKPKETTVTVQANAPFGIAKMLYEKAPMEIGGDGSLRIRFQIRDDERNLLVVDTQNKTGILTVVDAPEESGLPLKCVPPSEATF